MALLIESLEEKILGLDIEIEDLHKVEPDHEYANIESELSTWSSLHDAPKGINTLAHDATILYTISTRRVGVSGKLFEKCRAVFVSPDRVVHSLSSEIAAKENKFPLALNPLDLASMLWMRDIGNEKIATNVLRQSMMAYVREKAISNKLWETFVSALKDAQSREMLSRDDIALILSSDDTSILLAEKQFDAPKQIIDSRYVESLRGRQKKLNSQVEYSQHLISRIDQRIHTLSHRCALVISHGLSIILALCLIAIVGLCLYWIGLDTTANALALLAFAVATVIVLVLGKDVKYASTIFKVKKRIYRKTYDVARQGMRKIFKPDGQESIEIEAADA